MERIDRLHPVTILMYFVCVIAAAMFTMNPVIQIISLFGSVFLYMIVKGRQEIREWFLMGILVAAMLILHPLFNHNGKTVLFYVNGNRMTLEAFIYAAVMACLLAGVLIWCKSLSVIMTSDRIIYLFGRISQKAALICTIVIQFLPRYRKQLIQLRENQKLLGLYRDNSLWDKVRAELYLFSAMVTWSFEHSMDTADSMQARGYGLKKRSEYHEYRMRSADIRLMLMMCILMIWLIAGMAQGTLRMGYYPEIRMPEFGISVCTQYAAYLLLCLLLPLYQIYGKGLKRWNYTKQNI